MRTEDSDVNTTAASEAAAPRKRKAAAKKGKAKKAKTKVKASKAKRGDGKLSLDEERKDKYAAALRIRSGGPRAKLVEYLGKHSGKMFSADQLTKLVDWERRKLQNFIIVRIPFKSSKYRLGYKVLNDGEGNYGLEVK